MALVQALLSVRYTDPIHVPASTPMYIEVDDSKTIAEVITKMQADLLIWKGLTDDGIDGFSVSLEADTSATATPAADANSEQGLLVNFNQANSKYAFGVWVAGVKDTLIVNGKVVITDPAIGAFEGMIDAIGGTYEYFSKFYNKLDTLRDAAEAFRKLRRRAEKITKAFG